MARIFWQSPVSLALVVTAHYQTSRGTVTGTVLDSSGAVITGANVALTSWAADAGKSSGCLLGVRTFDEPCAGCLTIYASHSRHSCTSR
jgi:hypothetical protein